MTIFNFKTVGKVINDGVQIADKVPAYEIGLEEKGLNTPEQRKLSLKDQLFAHTSQAIRFLQINNLVPPLPPTVDVIFTSVSLAEDFVNRVKGIVGQRHAPQYSHLACADPAIATIYVSSGYLTNSNRYGDFSEALGVLAQEFGGDTKKILERDLFHEIGHLALREKFKHKRSEDSHGQLLSILKTNIEEGFADAFSLHLMSLKYPEHQQFPHIRSYMEKLSASLKSDQVSDVDVFRIYDMVPFMENGSVITDNEKLVDRCWMAALDNNKEILLSKMTFNPYFKQDVMKAINASTDDPQRIVAQFHQHVQNEGFDNKIILAMRNLYYRKDKKAPGSAF